MTKNTLDEILSRLHALQMELEEEIDRLLAEKRELFHYTLEQGKVRFERGIKLLQKRKRIAAWRYLLRARVGHIVSAPIIYSMFIPLALLDIAITLYQHICFRIYRIPRVKRSEYIILDRHHLAYLNLIERFNCLYCGYGNGLIEYAREVVARTENYWCPIKHARRSPDPHRFVEGFVDYGDADQYRERLAELRRELRLLKRKLRAREKD